MRKNKTKAHAAATGLILKKNQTPAYGLRCLPASRHAANYEKVHTLSPALHHRPEPKKTALCGIIRSMTQRVKNELEQVGRTKNESVNTKTSRQRDTLWWSQLKNKNTSYNEYKLQMTSLFLATP